MNPDLPHIQAIVLQSVQGFLMLMIIFVPLEMAFALRSTPLLRKNIHQDLVFHFLNALLPQLLLAALLSVLVAIIRPVYASGFFHWLSSIPLPLRFALAVINGDIGS
jgi:hypothetical protein